MLSLYVAKTDKNRILFVLWKLRTTRSVLEDASVDKMDTIYTEY